MNILHVVPYMHPHAGGPVIVVDRLAREQVDEGHLVRVVTTDELFTGNPEVDRAVLEDAPYESIVLNEGVNRLLAWRAPKRLKEVIEWADIVQCHTLWSGLVRTCCSEARRQRKPWVMMPHGMLDPNAMDVRRVRKSVYLRLVERANLAGASMLLFTCEQERALAIETWPTVANKDWAVTVPGAEPPVEPPSGQSAIREDLGLPENALMILFLSRIHPKKGIELLLEAVTRLESNEYLHVVLAGHGELGYVEKMQSLAKDLKISDRVHLPGHLSDDKWDAFASADLFVLPSYQENFGLVVAEAMHMGCPVVVSDRVNSCEHVEAAGCGRVYKFDGGVDSLALALDEMLSMDETERRRLGARGKEYALRMLTWQQCAQSTLRAYDRCLQKEVEHENATA